MTLKPGGFVRDDDPRFASLKQIGGNHYKDMAIQPSEFIFKNQLNWLEGNIIKYTCRHSRKNGMQDLEKARHYLDLLMEWQYGTRSNSTNED